ncbi:hypothetical protein D3C86_1680400 [compost metagenome]
MSLGFSQRGIEIGAGYVLIQSHDPPQQVRLHAGLGFLDPFLDFLLAHLAGSDAEDRFGDGLLEQETVFHVLAVIVVQRVEKQLGFQPMDEGLGAPLDHCSGLDLECVELAFEEVECAGVEPGPVLGPGRRNMRFLEILGSQVARGNLLLTFRQGCCQFLARPSVVGVCME